MSQFVCLYLYSQQALNNFSLQDRLCYFCDLPPEAHAHCYINQKGTITISMRRIDFNLPGEREKKIWTWQRCLKCPRENGLPPSNKRVILSSDTMSLSFGRFLELSFSDHNATTRVAECGHSVHKDCLRFYGYLHVPFKTLVFIFQTNILIIIHKKDNTYYILTFE